jgi:hypothetical protein
VDEAHCSYVALVVAAAVVRNRWDAAVSFHHRTILQAGSSSWDNCRHYYCNLFSEPPLARTTEPAPLEHGWAEPSRLHASCVGRRQLVGEELRRRWDIAALTAAVAAAELHWDVAVVDEAHCSYQSLVVYAARTPPLGSC